MHFDEKKTNLIPEKLESKNCFKILTLEIRPDPLRNILKSYNISF